MENKNEDNKILNMFIDNWGLDKVCYIGAWCGAGLSIGLLLGFATMNLIIDKGEDNDENELVK